MRVDNCKLPKDRNSNSNESKYTSNLSFPAISHGHRHYRQHLDQEQEQHRHQLQAGGNSPRRTIVIASQPAEEILPANPSPAGHNPLVFDTEYHSNTHSPISMAEFTSENTFPSLKIKWESIQAKKKTSASLIDLKVLFQIEPIPIFV